MRHVKLAVVLVLAILSLGATQCGPTVTNHFSSGLEGAGDVRAEFTVSVAEVTISSGSPNGLVDAGFVYNLPALEPQADYHVSNGSGLLIVRHPSGSVSTPPGTKSTWDVQLNPQVPLDLNMSLGVGDSHLNLGGLALTGLGIKAGVGDVALDFTGFEGRNLAGNIHAGVGDFTLRVPQNTGVRIRLTRGVGRVNTKGGWAVSGNTYTNCAWGVARDSIDLAITTGVGDVKLMLK